MMTLDDTYFMKQALIEAGKAANGAKSLWEQWLSAKNGS